MRLGVEAKRLYGSHRTGIPNYTWHILIALREVLPDLELYLYAPSGYTEAPLSALGDFQLRQRSAPLGIDGYFWTKFMAGKLVAKDDPDVFLAPRTLYPLGIAEKVPVVSVLHDLCYLIQPKAVPAGTLLNQRLWLRRDIRNAEKVVTVSAGTAKRMEALLGRQADAVVSPAVGAEFQPASAIEVERLRVSQRLPGPYILFVGTLEPRKNLEALLDALPIVNERRLTPITLVLAGQRGWRNKTLTARLDSGESNVRELGYVPPADLPALYSGAEVFVIPSFYEGFGMPAAEARACGTRVVATDTPELREAAGKDATFVGTTAEALAEGIVAALSHPPPKQVTPRTWRESAEVLAAVLEDAAARKFRKR